MGGKPFSTNPCSVLTKGFVDYHQTGKSSAAFGKNSQLTKLEYFQRFWPPTTMFSPLNLLSGPDW